MKFLLCILLTSILLGLAVGSHADIMNRKDILLRDPYIFLDPVSSKYYMYGTSTYDGKQGFDAYESIDRDFQNWKQPDAVFRRSDDFWATLAYWAPEVFYYRGSYYMFATFGSQKRNKGVQILKADSPTGPFKPHSPEPVTPAKYHALDGTLYIDKNGDPWMVYSREWASVYNGQIRAMRLKPDLSGQLEGTDDILLFRANEAKYSAYWTNEDDIHCWLTDGPQLFRMKNGELVMTWSTNSVIPKPIVWSYTVMVARSTSGDITGPWIQEEKPLYNGFAGHGMLLRDKEGYIKLAMHQPNNGGRPYPLFIDVYENNGKLTTSDPETPGHVKSYWRFEDLTADIRVLPSIGILDSSGKENHLLGVDFDSVGYGSDKTEQKTIPQTGRKNFYCYDNSKAASAAVLSYLKTSDSDLSRTILQKWTVEASICLKQSGKNQTFIARTDQKGNILCRFYIDRKGYLAAEFYSKGKPYISIASKRVIEQNQWYNAAFTNDGKLLRIYVDRLDGKGYVHENAVHLTSSDSLVPLSKGEWYIGCGIHNSEKAEQFYGLIDEVRISNKTLSVKQLLFYNTEKQ